MPPSHNMPAAIRALVVEDEPMLALFVEQVLADIGIAAEIVGTLNEGVTAAIERPVDFAIVDLNLDGELAFPVVDICRARGLPLVIASGYGAAALRPEDADVPLLAKPFRVDALIAMAELLTHKAAVRQAHLQKPAPLTSALI